MRKIFTEFIPLLCLRFYKFVLPSAMLLCFALPLYASDIIRQGDVFIRQGEVVEGDVLSRMGSVTVEGEVEGDVTSQVGSVTVKGKAKGDVTSFKDLLIVSGAVVEGDVLSRMGSVTVEGEVEGDVTSQAGSVTVRGKAKGDVTSLKDLMVISGAVVGGDVLSRTGSVIVDGEAGGDVTSQAGSVTVKGKAQSDVTSLKDLLIMPGAVVEGDAISRAGRVIVEGEVKGDVVEFSSARPGVASSEKGKAEPPTLECPKTDQPPKIDGVLNDPAWKKAAQIDHFVSMNGGYLEEDQTEAYLLWDKENLYVAFKCYDSHIDELKIEQTERDDDVYWDDSVEIFLSKGEGPEPYYQLVVNPIGTLFDQVKKKASLATEGRQWSSEAQVATFIGAEFWAGEIAIPWKNVGSTPDTNSTRRLNIYREGHNPGSRLSGWSPTYTGNFHTPRRFGKLTFTGEKPKEAKKELSENAVKISEIRISGNKEIPTSEILEAIEVKPGDSVTEETLSQAKKEILATGYFSNTEVALEKSDGSVVLSIKVTEKPIYEIEKIKVEIDTTDLVTGGKSIKGEVKRSVKATFKINGETHQLDIPPIPEVPKFDILIPGAPKVDEAEILRWFSGTLPGRFFVGDLEVRCRLVEKFYRDKGYGAASVAYKYITESKTLNVNVDIGRITDIRISGIHHVDEVEILRLLENLKIAPGDVYYKDAIDKAVSEIKRKTGKFKRIDFKLEPGNVLSIHVSERNAIESNFQSGGGFNRVEGLFLNAKFKAQTVFGPQGSVFAQGGYGFSRKKWTYKFGAEKSWFSERKLSIGAEGYDIVDTQDRWVVSDDEASGLAFLAGLDTRDYFSRKGYEAYANYVIGWGNAVRIRYNDDEYESLFKKTDWSLFNRKHTKRENLLVDEGRMQSTGLTYTYVWGEEGKERWKFEASAEQAGKDLGGDFTFRRYYADLRLYQRLTPGSSMKVRAKFGTSTDGDLPVQKKYFLGGYSTLPGFEYKAFQGDKMALANFEYHLGGTQGSPGLIWFFDAGKTWQRGESTNLTDDLKYDAGIGLVLGGWKEKPTLRVNWAVPLSEKERKGRWELRLETPF